MSAWIPSSRVPDGGSVATATAVDPFGVTMTPALAVNGEVKSQGKILSAKEIEALIV